MNHFQKKKKKVELLVRPLHEELFRDVRRKKKKKVMKAAQEITAKCIYSLD